MSYPNAQILSFERDGVRPVAYTATEHFKTTSDFLRDHTGMLRKLLADADES